MEHEEEIATPHGRVTTITEAPGTDAPAIVLLAHGAGAGQRHPWMIAMRGALVGRGLAVMTFDYAYMEAGRKAPDRLPKLLDVHEAVATSAAERGVPVIIAGKSMGGRVGGHLVAERGFRARAVAYLGYPLVAMGKTEPRDTSHLDGIVVPQAFISGDRDRLGPIDLVRAVADRVPNGAVTAIETGDHSLKPLKASGRTVEDSIDTAAAVIRDLVV